MIRLDPIFYYNGERGVIKEWGVLEYLYGLFNIGLKTFYKEATF